ncbi:response regulator receiver domain protein (CheY-like) [Sulfurimonas denitrificans DSM 1251]|uniref:Response regulator receiver domain protein (CheY-like) n=1 Tax=Sulfurimonas denitrificans (strain ATCC 33889 / DSM 1251) TaxID=326298 RepID=Q30Q98_SULDN|nr:response regulator [Sulfurimonas denitrificans]ABB44833.1 response regulator receiver domain protein (CheY-like) [Sulfurimonas denitrificans DSM 1251]MDD3443263.1 response regulator [Sulfurimonas denitrificans]
MIDILIVDDSSIIRKIFSDHIEKMGYKVVGVAKDGREAIKLYEELRPDLVTMDITMPIMNGIDSLKAIKSKFSDAKVIMITSHGEERLVMEAISSGAKGYVLKPITLENVQQAIYKVFPELATKQ